MMASIQQKNFFIDSPTSKDLQIESHVEQKNLLKQWAGASSDHRLKMLKKVYCSPYKLKDPPKDLHKARRVQSVQKTLSKVSTNLTSLNNPNRPTDHKLDHRTDHRLEHRLDHRTEHGGTEMRRTEQDKVNNSLSLININILSESKPRE
mmetsp:Transcript_5313/g.4909  ORF Transcript_5313/g.4909 Transcript_5313/m.4909 type:complete len:149 (-) Transcript_5313:741-1187(-)